MPTPRHPSCLPAATPSLTPAVWQTFSGEEGTSQNGGEGEESFIKNIQILTVHITRSSKPGSINCLARQEDEVRPRKQVEDSFLKD